MASDEQTVKCGCCRSSVSRADAVLAYLDATDGSQNLTCYVCGPCVLVLTVARELGGWGVVLTATNGSEVAVTLQ